MPSVKEYLILRNGFTEKNSDELVGRFYNLELAKDFVEYQDSVGEKFVIMCDGEIVDFEQSHSWQPK